MEVHGRLRRRRRRSRDQNATLSAVVSNSDVHADSHATAVPDDPPVLPSREPTAMKNERAHVYEDVPHEEMIDSCANYEPPLMKSHIF